MSSAVGSILFQDGIRLIFLQSGIIELDPNNKKPLNTEVSIDKQQPTLSTKEIVQMAWSEKITFAHMQKATGLGSQEIVELMRKELNANSFRNWQKKKLDQKEKLSPKRSHRRSRS